MREEKVTRKIIAFLLFIALLPAVPSRAQDKANVYTGAGSPEGAVAGCAGDVFISSNGTTYLKNQGCGNKTGWASYGGHGSSSCTELWGGSGTSFALTSGDDAVANNLCYNDSGATRTITAVKCRGDSASNTTTVNPTLGSAGTGTTILSGALTCGNSNAYSASGTISNGAWATGAGITPAMGGTLTGTTIAMIVEYNY